MTVAPTDCYRRNIRALRASQPTVASAVEAVSIPDGVRLATGRDGNDTFLMPAPDGRSVWFGASSMPSISAAQVVGVIPKDGRSIVLPGVLTGVEPLLIADRLLPHSAVFVLESDPVLLKLALHVRDFTTQIDTERIVFISTPEDRLTEGLSAFFEAHLGFELPCHLVPVPQRSASELSELQARIEKAGQAVANIQSRVVASLGEALCRRACGSLPDTPRVAVLSMNAQPASLEHARRIDRALARLEWPHALCIPDSPNRCHSVARMQTIADIEAELIIVVDGDPAAIRSHPPAGFPIVSWYSPAASVQNPPSPTKPSQDLMCISSSAVREHLTTLGMPADAIAQMAPAADDVAYHPLSDRQTVDANAEPTIAIVADLPDDRPESINITQASHLALWEALKQVTTKRADNLRNDDLDELLNQAQRASGTTLEEQQVRAHFLDLLRSRIIPATIARVAAETLQAQKHLVELWGNSWPTPAGSRDIRRGPIPVGPDLNDVLNRVDVVVLPDASALSVQTALDALSAGTRVVCLEPDTRFEQLYPGLEDVTPFLRFYRTPHQLVESVEASVADSRSSGVAAATFVHEYHTVAHRLKVLVKLVQQRKVAMATSVANR